MAEVQPVELVVCSSVAVNPDGARVGKGGGFSDLEVALLVEAGLIGDDTVVATTVHPLQVLKEALPETDHDFRLDLIVAGEEVIACRRSRRPLGIFWEHLDVPRSPPSPPWPPAHQMRSCPRPDRRRGAGGAGIRRLWEPDPVATRASDASRSEPGYEVSTDIRPKWIGGHPRRIGPERVLPAFCAGHGVVVGLPGLEPGTSSLSAKCTEPLCQAPFPQVASDR